MKEFDLTVRVEQDFGYGINKCDHLPSDTNVTISSDVGLNPLSTSDKNYLARLDDPEDFQRCSLAKPCVEKIQHGEANSPSETETFNAHVRKKLRAGPPELVYPYEKTILITVTNMKKTHTARILLVGDYNEGIPEKLPLPAVEPIMIIRDPPGGESHAYYHNVRTMSTISLKGYESYFDHHANIHVGGGVDLETEICAGFGVST